MINSFGWGDHRKYHLYRKETDMRKGFDSLCGIISGELGKRVMDGDVFVFISKPRTHIKMLVWETGGFTLLYRRLEQGTFEVPAFDLDDQEHAYHFRSVAVYFTGHFSERNKIPQKIPTTACNLLIKTDHLLWYF